LLNLCSQTLPWYELFFAMDANEDGKLDYAEFVTGMECLTCAVPNGKLMQLARMLDVDCNGTIDWVEWVAVALLSSRGNNMEPEPLRTAFRLLDRPTGDNALGAADLLSVISSSAPNGVLAKRAVQNILGKWGRGHDDCHHSLDLDHVQTLLVAVNETPPGGAPPSMRGSGSVVFGDRPEVLNTPTRSGAAGGC